MKTRVFLRDHLVTEGQVNKICFSISEACAATSFGRTSIYKLIREGQLKAVRVGGRTLVPAESLRALLDGDAR